MKCLAIFAVLIAFNATAFADDAPDSQGSPWTRRIAMH